MPDYMDDIFGLDGLLAQRFDAYVPREGQISLARHVDKVLSEGGHLLAEGATGTGKTWSYCIPAIRHCAEMGKKIGLVTANIALQEQLVSKDLPLLQSILPWDFTFALLKGRRNFLCVDRYYEELARQDLFWEASEGREEAWETLLQWAQTTRTGDLAELAFIPEPRLWNKLSVGAEDCKGEACRYRGECLYERARLEAFQADILVTNYHLFFANLQLREATGSDRVLPELDAVILDEAHRAADIACDFFGFRITQGGIQRALHGLEERGHAELKNEILRESEAFFEALVRLRRSDAYRIRLREPNAVACGRLCTLLETAATAIRELREASEDEEERTLLGGLARRCETLAERLDTALSLADEDAVSFIEENAARAVLCWKPIRVAERLREDLFTEANTTVLTSATMTVEGRFDPLRRELGIDRATEFVAASPFDARQALLIVPKHLPLPTESAFPTAVAETVARAVDLAHGRTLALFTSYRNLRLARKRLEGCPYRVLCQGDAPRQALLEAFRRDVHSVLLGTESFWTGVDVPGEALSCVIIDRLPFPTPDDPVLDAIAARDRSWFSTYSLPRAVIAFRQGFGRLIRSTRDRGVVVLLDRRIVEKPYGRCFVNSLPALPKSRELHHLAEFLEVERCTPSWME